MRTASNQQIEPVEGGVTNVGVSYNKWDADNDNRITEEEFNTGSNDFFASYDFNEYGQFDEWDTNMDSELNDVEFQNKITSILSSPDNTEGAGRLMTVWNQDNDNNIERIDLQNITVLLDKDNN